jgi:hypothetical protein
MMHVDFEIHGHFYVPDGTIAVPETSNLFQLPSGRVVSVHPIIELSSTVDADDHRDLSYAEALGLGIQFDLYDRSSCLSGVR